MVRNNKNPPQEQRTGPNADCSSIDIKSLGLYQPATQRLVVHNLDVFYEEICAELSKRGLPPDYSKFYEIDEKGRVLRVHEQVPPESYQKQLLNSEKRIITLWNLVRHFHPDLHLYGTALAYFELRRQARRAGALILAEGATANLTDLWARIVAERAYTERFKNHLAGPLEEIRKNRKRLDTGRQNSIDSRSSQFQETLDWVEPFVFKHWQITAFDKVTLSHNIVEELKLDEEEAQLEAKKRKLSIEKRTIPAESTIRRRYLNFFL